jgi:protein kinase C substrate 80K-H
MHSFRQFLVDNGILANTFSPSSSETRAVTEARDAWTAVKNDIQSKQSELSSKRTDLTADYGPQGVFRALKDTCISLDAGEYNYELCFLARTTQKSLKNGGSTSLGDFRRLEKVVVDEDLPADGRGLGSGERWAMVFEDGQQCWNGPRRSTTVVMVCREKEELWKVVEAEKCVYRMEVGTPAVCEEGAGQKKGVKDEL